MTADFTSFVQEIPKAEIHVHLEGSIGPATLLELARRHKRTDLLPSQELHELQKWFQFVDFPHFVEIYMAISELLRTSEDFALVVVKCAESMAKQNIRYGEFTVTPFSHTDIQRKGLSIEQLLAGLEYGRRLARQQHGVEIRWIFDVPRNASFRADGDKYDPYPAERTLSHALAGIGKGVVGFGLGGFEVGAPPEPFAQTFAAAKSAGLVSVPHAGETVGPSSIWGSINFLDADRIGHGVRAIEDPALLSLLLERQIPLELSLTSNICLHVYRRVSEHPFPHLDKMGLLLTLNSDDPPLFSTTLCQEYAILAKEFGYTQQEVVRIARNAFESCAAPPALKSQLLADFDAWTKANLVTGSNE